nr:Chain C, MODEL PEPTIDE SEQUENCE - ARAAAAAAA [unidentified]1HSA_F Chain F, MODEL PEPTIDE SEQUENCE - ARAAAAAAA [unidentified]
ARAAAAAAA